MNDFEFSARFLLDLSAWEKTASPRDRDALEQTLAAIAKDPSLPGRVPSFYDPKEPSWLYRSGQFLVHYRIGDQGGVEFLNLFA